MGLSGVFEMLARGGGSIERRLVVVAQPLTLLTGVMKEPGDGTPRFHPIIARNGWGKVAGAGADPNRADSIGVNLWAAREKPESRAEVFNLAPRMLVRRAARATCR